MFKNYYLGSYKDFSSDVGPIIQCIGLQGEDLVGLELGVYKADSFMTILENCPNVKTLYGVDSYKPYVDFFERREVSNFELAMIRTESLLKQQYSEHKDKIVFLEKTSAEAAKEIEDNSLDFIFIDADHTYDSVIHDLTVWYPKVKCGGLISGHDYIMTPVENAVNDFRKFNQINNRMNTYLSCYVWKK